MKQLNPGDNITLREPSEDDPSVEVLTPAVVKQIRWQATENGEAAIAVLLTFGEMITTRVITLHTEVALAECDAAAEDCDYRCFLATEKIEMATPEVIAEIQERLRVQRDNMKVSIQAAVQTPVTRGASGRASEATRTRQLERAKLKRAEERELRNRVIGAVMEQQNCSEAEAIVYLKKQAGL
jgi:transcriptional regulator NrdR family protein